jgi:hypothetical protein
MIQIPKDKWTWGKIKKILEKSGIHNGTKIWYIDIGQESDTDIIINTGEERGAEITNHPDL